MPFPPSTEGRGEYTQKLRIKWYMRPPVWNTPAPLGSYTEGDTIGNHPLIAYHPAGLTYTVLSSNLPAGLTYDPLTHTVSGTITPNGLRKDNVQITIRATATDQWAMSIDRIFTMTVYVPPPLWETDANLGDFPEHEPINVQVHATHRAGILYSMLGYFMPPNIINAWSWSFNTTTGTINVTAPLTDISADTNWWYNIRAYAGSTAGVYEDRTFILRIPNIVEGITWTNPDTLPSSFSGASWSYQMNATDGDHLPVTYSMAGGELPPNVTLSSTGRLSGTLPVVTETQWYYFSITAATSHLSVTRNFAIPVFAGTRLVTYPDGITVDNELIAWNGTFVNDKVGMTWVGGYINSYPDGGYGPFDTSACWTFRIGYGYQGPYGHGFETTLGTYMCWIKETRMLGWAASGNRPEQCPINCFGWIHDGTHGIGIANGKMAVGRYQEGADVIADGQWHLLAWVNTGSLGHYNMYASLNGAITYQGYAAAIYIGGLNSIGAGYPYSPHWPGPEEAACFRVFNTQLSPGQLQQIYDVDIMSLG